MSTEPPIVDPVKIVGPARPLREVLPDLATRAEEMGIDVDHPKDQTIFATRTLAREVLAARSDVSPTGAEPRRWKAYVCPECGDLSTTTGECFGQPWLVLHPHKPMRFVPIEVQAVVDDEQTEARKNIERMRELTDEVARLNARIHGAERSETYKLYRQALKDNAEFAMRVERLEAELREAGEALRAFVAISPGPLDTQTGIVGRPPEEQVDEYRQRATKVADDLRIARDRARGVLEKDKETT